MTKKSSFTKLTHFIFIVTLAVSLVNCGKNSVKSFDGTEISYQRKGEGDVALVFVHGWSCDQSYWSEQVKYFEKKFQVITLDLAGHGESGITREDYKISSYGKDVGAVVNKLNPKKVILIGHSMGGAVLLESVASIKPKILGLIGVDTYHSLSAEYTEKDKEMYLAPLEHDFKKGAYNFVVSMFTKSADKELVKKIATDMSMQLPRVGISSMKNYISKNDAKRIKNYDIPLKTINADLWPTDVKGNQKVYKSFELKLMNGYGHFIAQEDPAVFNQHLNSFILQLTR